MPKAGKKLGRRENTCVPKGVRYSGSSAKSYRLLLLDLEPGVLEMGMATAGLGKRRLLSVLNPLLGKACNSSALFIQMETEGWYETEHVCSGKRAFVL